MASKESKCVFCDIIAGQLSESKIEFENENLVIIKDIRPASDFHYLAVPKKHIDDATNLKIADGPLVIEMETELRNFFAKEGIDADSASFGFHWPPFISVKHLHMHAIAPTSKMAFLSKWVFKPLNLWYCTPQYVLTNLKNDDSR